MKSKAHLKGHPLHPMLILFPIAFLTGSFISDLAAWLRNDPGFWMLAFWLQIAGVATGLLAAIPGIIDFIYTVPPHSSAKSRGAKHGVLNTLNILLFLAVWFYRQKEDPSTALIIILEFAGVIGLTVAGWMGGTLVYRNQIGVDPRYANAGKWKEEFFRANVKIEIATTGELQENQMKLLHINSKRIVLAKTKERYVAFDDRCTHKGGSLAGGSMICGTVQCPWHGSQFGVNDGGVKAGPAKDGIKTYKVSESDGKVWLLMEEQINQLPA
ncbi:MAG: DUF2231 domain-containing protein [Bacteroidota bacterium]